MPLDVGFSFDLQLIENSNVNDNKVINNLNDKRLVKTVVLCFSSLLFSSLLHENLSPC